MCVYARARVCLSMCVCVCVCVCVCHEPQAAIWVAESNDRQKRLDRHHRRHRSVPLAHLHQAQLGVEGLICRIAQKRPVPKCTRSYFRPPTDHTDDVIVA